MTDEAHASTFLVLVTGHAAAGKTTLAEQLARDLDAVWISRDAVHAMVYSGWTPHHPALTSPCYDPTVGGNTYFEGGVVWTIFLWMLRTVLPHKAVVADTPFNHPWNREMFAETAAQLTVPVIEVALYGEPQALLGRARLRAAEPGTHELKARFSVLPERYATAYEPVLGPAHVVRVDTTDLDTVDIASVSESIRKTLDWQARTD